MIKEIVVGTTNRAKFEQIRGALSPLNLEISMIKNKEDVPAIEEDGETVQENARKKALAYAKVLNMPVLSMDNAFYLEGLEKERQPGIHVRRINKTSDQATDKQMLEYYTNLLKELGGDVNGHWEFGICIATPEGTIKETTIVSPRVFTSVPSQKMTPGYPLESIQKDPDTGKYTSEMSQEEKDLFWQKAIGKQLCEFVQTSLSQ